MSFDAVDVMPLSRIVLLICAVVHTLQSVAPKQDISDRDTCTWCCTACAFDVTWSTANFAAGNHETSQVKVPQDKVWQAVLVPGHPPQSNVLTLNVPVEDSMVMGFDSVEVMDVVDSQV
ncbi:hypothetical protein K470DRAFT_262336 [Piedraia hortae CBS 480.64]|uniref:Uncharacterized protein n=1 Tax=Piedraia hortae CBS 480.64 TaxID=1314780 RepID=A0A6A7C822_9PEZI|nr:hypothetical protein K470DRAFT_262336 [Piedraia hortae CBS 480.64]